MGSLVATCDEELARLVEHMRAGEDVEGDRRLLDSWLETRLLLSETEIPQSAGNTIA